MLVVRLFWVTLFFFAQFSHSSTLSVSYDLSQEAIFPGQVSRLNETAQIMRVRLDFKNAKFLNKNDRVEFWNESHPHRRCVGLVLGRSTTHLLFKIPEYKQCILKVHVTTGSTLHFWSQDLENNLKTARELNEILLKKRMAMLAKKQQFKRELDAHVEKVEALNRRYEVLRQKLEAEWQKELALLEEDKADNFVQFKQTETSLNEIESKLESYRIHEHNFTEDRWSLDPDLYFKK
jgi:hypothetical protein